LFHADEEIVFAVTFGTTWHGHSDDLPYSEVDWLEPEAVRLLGSLVLTERFVDGMHCRFYPLAHGGFIVDEASLDLCDPATAQSVKKALLATINNPDWPEHVQANWSLCRCDEFVLFDPGELNIDLLQAYWQQVLVNNRVLLRGLQALIKSDMLGHHHEFQEEGAVAAFIAMDASFELVRRHLRANGNANPTAQDAGDWLYKTFDEPLGVYGSEGLKYFEEFYRQRVQTVHPASRYGDMPYAPVMVDDRIHLREALPGVLAYLVLGKHPPSFWERVAEHRAGKSSFRDRVRLPTETS
jgi:hypothetical protein